MISKLPPWIWIGGSLLAFAAGMINAVGFLGINHEALTHLTGTVTLSAVAASARDWAICLHMGALVLAFLSGAILSGFIIQQSSLQLGLRYGTALLIESVLILISIPLLDAGLSYGEYFASAACGLQNAMASSYSGAVVRTTHLTGIVTDLGIFCGHWLRGLRPDFRRIRLYLALLFGFLFGGVAGALLYEAYAYGALYVPAAMTGGSGIAYTAYKIYRRTRGRRKAGR